MTQGRIPHIKLASLALAAALLLGLAGPSTLPVGTDYAEAGKRKKRLIASDTAALQSPLRFWGDVECERADRHRWFATGGDQHRTALNRLQSDNAFRRLTVFDGDEFWGERCELGDNARPGGPTIFYREGKRRITQLSLRLADNFPIHANTWQSVIQMKQVGASATANGGTPALELDVYGGRWRLRQSLNNKIAYDSRELWSAPAERGHWTRFSFDITYSRSARKGRIHLKIDLNGDGDFLDSGERSPTFRTYTLKVEIPGGGPDGVAPGESIPSHLRVGIYHNPSISCPLLTGCQIDVDNVQVRRP